MSLLRVSALRAAEGSGAPSGVWLPSHVQVRVGAARGLRLKGGPGPGDAFVLLQLGRQKHRTAVATLRGGGGGEEQGPRWGEEVALEMPPAAPGETETDPDAAALLLQLSVWQRALVGPDRFLGRALLPLGPLLQAGRAHPDQWHKLHSKPGKKEKERGEVQVSIHFTRHSLTASMFDLSVKDKPRSPFRKLRDKMKGRRQYDLESASAIVPCSSGALEEDFGLGGKKAKGGGFFFKNRLRKSSLTQSSTSLGSDSTLSSASSMVGLAAPEAVVAAPSPGRHGSLPAEYSGRDFPPSPKPTHKRAFSDEVSQINTLPASRSVQSLKPQSEPISRSSLCINGSHIYCEEPSPRPAACPSSAAAAPLSKPKKPAEDFSSAPPAPESELPPWSGGSSSFQRPPQKDPPRFIPSPPILAAQEEAKLSVKTLALSKQRSRAKMDEGARAEGKPVQVAMPMPVAFSAEAGRGRPPEEAQKEEKRAKAGFFRRGSSKEDTGKSPAAAGGPEGDKSSSWFSLKDAQEPSQRPSSQPGLPAATETEESTGDACACEDRGPSAFLRAGTPQPTSAPPSVSAFEPAAEAAAAGPPLEWGDPFDALATSRLRPGAPRELPPPLHWDAASEGLADRDPPEEEEGSPPHGSAGLPPRWPSEPEGSPGVAPDETVVVVGESPGEQPWGTCVEGRPGHSPLGPCEEEAVFGVSLNWKVVEADPWAEVWPASAVGAPLPLGQAPESNTSPSGSLEKPPPSSPTDSKPETLERSLTSEAETAEDAARREQAAPQMPPAPGQQPAPGEDQLPEEAEEPGSPAEEEKEEEGRGAPSESWEQRGEGGQGAEAAPPKPPRWFTPLSLEEEADLGLWGARLRCESQGGPRVEADGQGPPVGDGSAPWVIGAGGGSGTEGLLVPTTANELARQAGPLGGSELAAAGGAGGAEQLETCPGKPGLAGEEPLPAGLESPQGPGRLPVAEEGGLRPSETPQGPPEPSPSVLFWTALEEQLLQAPDGASPEQARGLSEGTPDLEPSLEQVGEAALASPRADRTGSQSSWAAPASPQGLVSGALRQGPPGSSASDSVLSSSWSDDRVVDFKRADFWQAERGEGSGAPSNPFVSRVSPQNNPFVERPTGALPATLGEGPSFRGPHAEAAPQGLPPAAPLTQGQPPAAPLPHDHQPLAFSTPSLEEEAVSPGEFNFPSPIVPPAPGKGSAASSGLLSLALPSPGTDAAASSASPTEPRPADEVPVQRTTSPHLVKPIPVSRPLEKQRRSSLPLSQEKLKPKPTSSNESAAPILPLEKTDPKREPSLPDCSAKYYHLTHDELIQLLLKREAELSKKQDHIRELENYIDRLLVRIMEQSPTLLQIPLGGGVKAAK